MAAEKPLSAGSTIRSAVLWNTGLNLLREILQFGTMLVLVRRLDPSAYGEFGFVTSILGFFTILSFRGFLEHTLQLPPSTAPDYQNIFSIGGMIQATVFVAVNLTAGALQFIPRYAPVAPLLHVMSVLFLLDWLSELRVKMLERECDWASLRILQGAGVVMNSGCALVLAWMGAGAYALLIPGLLINVPAICDLFFRADWRPTWEFSWERFRPTFRYGVARVGSGILQNGRQLLESAMLVRFLGFAGAGIYGRALGLATIACLRFPSYLTLTMYPVLSRVGPGEQAGRRAGVLVIQSILWTIVPLAALMHALAEPVVRTLYGEKWLTAVPLLPWTLLLTGLIALSQPLSILLLVNLRERQCFYADLISTAGVLLSLALLLPRGVELYLTGVVMSLLVEVLAMLWWLYRAGGIELAPLFRVAGPPFAAAAFLLLVNSQARLRVVTSLWTPGSMLVFVIVFFCLYVLTLRVTAATSLAELVSFCPGKSGLQRLLRLPSC